MYKLILIDQSEQLVESFCEWDTCPLFIIFKYDDGRDLIVNKSEIRCIVQL